MLLSLFVGCDAESRSAKGFALPPGDVVRGQAAFEALACVSCHTVDGVDLATTGNYQVGPVLLGGEVRRVRTYGQLVTSIIHPSHDIARGYDEAEVAREGVSKMPGFNDRMTVKQMIDLVAFLHARYSLLLPDYETYPYL